MASDAGVIGVLVLRAYFSAVHDPFGVFVNEHNVGDASVHADADTQATEGREGEVGAGVDHG
jgi:hypothetical protein